MTGTKQIERTDILATRFIQPVGRVGIEFLRAIAGTGGRTRDEIDHRERSVTLFASDTDAGTRRRFDGDELVSTGATDPGERGVTPDE